MYELLNVFWDFEEIINDPAEIMDEIIG